MARKIDLANDVLHSMDIIQTELGMISTAEMIEEPNKDEYLDTVKNVQSVLNAARGILLRQQYGFLKEEVGTERGEGTVRMICRNIGAFDKTPELSPAPRK
jgi:hypothetical protein